MMRDLRYVGYRERFGDYRVRSWIVLEVMLMNKAEREMREDLIQITMINIIHDLDRINGWLDQMKEE